jgi:hypothetical protein
VGNEDQCFFVKMPSFFQRFPQGFHMMYSYASKK